MIDKQNRSGSRNVVNDNKSLYAIGYILLCRAARCLYNIISDGTPEVSWDDCCRAICNTPDLQDILYAVITKSIRRFAMDGKFNFQAAPVSLAAARELDQETGNAVIDRELAESVATSLLLFAQSSHYAQRSKVIQYYTMDDYLAELTDDAMSRTLMSGFRDAIYRLDFFEDWTERIDEVQEILSA
ncbi:hypothetical protein [Flavonifractor sp. An306]|uniref:hypothetical protein n=1 Tax=Flavonifractor sp. An306 TaxID=1965629 RepID=UPI00174CDCC5|nr:hypothetical protein [Flavonifractor sp. An306]